MGLTVLLSLLALLVSWFIAIPIGVYSATHQYSILDYMVTFISFIGIGTPGFLLALSDHVACDELLGMNVGGLFSQRVYQCAPWSWGKVVDMLQHIWIPVL